MNAVAAERSDLIDCVHRSPSMAVLVVTGGGSRAVADLLTVPGASRTVLEAWAPYGKRSLAGFLGASPRQAVSVETASAMARKACERAVLLRPRADAPVVGVACTAALATDRPRRGEHRAHVAVCAGGTVTIHSVTLDKGVRSREVEERVVADLVLSAVGRACGVESHACDALLPWEEVRVQAVREPEGGGPGTGTVRPVPGPRRSPRERTAGSTSTEAGQTEGGPYVPKL